MTSLLRSVDMAARLARARVAHRHPLYLVHALTARCNARCGFCAWNPDFYDDRGQLTAEQIERLYDEARALGFIGLSLWGGEPLVFKHFGRVARHAHQIGLETNLVTNGFLLKKRLDDVVSTIDRVSISLDHASPRHDTIRGISGLFDAITSGIDALRSRAPDKPVVLVTTLQRDNCDEASIRALASLAADLRVVSVFNALREEAASTDDVDLSPFAPTQDQLTDAFALLGRLKQAGYPIVNSHTHLSMMVSAPPVYRCHWPKLMLPIEANGDVVDCMRWGTHPVGNITRQSLADVLKSPRLRDLAGPAGEACHRCVSVHRIEISEIWEGNLEPLSSWRLVASAPPHRPARSLPVV